METAFDAIALNLVLHEKATGARYAVVAQGRSGEPLIALERIDIPNQWPISIPRQKLVEAIRNNGYIIDYAYAESRNLSLYITPHVTPKKAMADNRRWKLIADVLETPEYLKIVYGINRTKNLDKLASRLEVSRTHLRTLLMLFWRNGMTKAATQTHLDKCGRVADLQCILPDERYGPPRRHIFNDILKRRRTS